MKFKLNLQRFAEDEGGAAETVPAAAETAPAAETNDAPMTVSAGDTLPDGQVLKIWAAKPLTGISEGKPGDFLRADSKDGLIIRTGENTALEVLQMQMPGGKRMAPKDYLRGHRL